MCTAAVPAGEADELDLLQTLMGSLAGADPAGLGEQEVARRLRVLEQVDAIEAAVRGRLLEVFDAQDGHLADGQRSTRTWLVQCTRVTRGQAGEYQAVQGLAREHPVLLAALAEGDVLTKLVALQLARWTRPIPGGLPGQGRGDPGRRGPGRGRPAGAGRDLRGDPVPDRAAGPGG